MDSTMDRLQAVRSPPDWSYVGLSLVTVAVFATTLPFGLDVLPDIAIEGFYFLLAVATFVPVRRLDVPVLEIGWFVFVLGRLVDFLDERSVAVTATCRS